jgi:hypothetical protein
MKAQVPTSDALDQKELPEVTTAAKRGNSGSCALESHSFVTGLDHR